jgi:D-alanyl-D-alanine carboxypeptidase
MTRRRLPFLTRPEATVHHLLDSTATRPDSQSRGRRRRILVGTCALLVLVSGTIWAAATRGRSTAVSTSMEADAPLGSDGIAHVPPRGTESSDVPQDHPITPFDTDNAALSHLDKRLLHAVQQAARRAQAEGIEFTVTSGWRSREHQQRLLDEGIATYGSLEKAREFVNTPDKSTHVSGKAIDIGPTDADDWLIRNGAAFGLCQVYANEMWHFELLAGSGSTCPPPMADAAR